MGINFFAAIDSSSAQLSNYTWNQLRLCQAAQTQVPDASEVTTMVGRRCGGCKKETPFHAVTNSAHQAMSILQPLLVRTKPWLPGLTSVLCRVSSSRRRKATTLHA